MRTKTKTIPTVLPAVGAGQNAEGGSAEDSPGSGLVLILFERDNIFRQIFTDGRPMPVDPQPAYNGYSIGKWEGDTFVVQTAGFKDGMWLDNIGSPFTAAAKVTERFHRPSFGNLEIDVTVDDPKGLHEALELYSASSDCGRHGNYGILLH